MASETTHLAGTSLVYNRDNSAGQDKISNIFLHVIAFCRVNPGKVGWKIKQARF